jgi:hypothetical protein
MTNGIVSFFSRAFGSFPGSGPPQGRQESREASLKVCRQIICRLKSLINWKTVRDAFVHYIPGGICPEPQDRLALGRCGKIGLEAFPLATFLLDLEVVAGGTGSAIETSLPDIDKQSYPGDGLRVTEKAVRNAIGTIPSCYGLHSR